jgi:hypothetical protein
MKLKELKKEIKGVFKPLKKRYYIGRLWYGSPYFYPWNFNEKIISFRKLKLRPEKEWKHLPPYQVKAKKFNNLPMVRRSKEWIFKLFGNYYWLQIGTPISIVKYGLGWKDKFESPRFEWNPSFQIYFFYWQFCIWWGSPYGVKADDLYFEMILWYSRYAGRDIKKAEETWGWADWYTKKSTWNDKFLINK